MDNETRQETPLPEEARIHDADWVNRFIEVHLNDVCDSKYQLFKSDNRSLSLRIQNGRIDFTGIDYGDPCEMINGTDEYEFHYCLDENNTHILLEQLRLEYGLTESLSDILEKAFGCDDGSVKFERYCDHIGVEVQFLSF